MGAASVNPTALPERGTDWLPRLCERFSNATGWPMRFVPANEAQTSRAASAWFGRPCWQAELHDGEQTVGQLELAFPDGRLNDPSFAAVRQLTENLAELLERVLTANRRPQLRRQPREAAVAAEPTSPSGQTLVAVLRQLLRAGLQLSGFHGASFFLLNPAAEELCLRASHRIDPNDVPHPVRPLADEPPDCQIVWNKTRVLIRRGDRLAGAWLPAEAAIGIGLPVESSGGVLGTMWFYDRRVRTIEPREKQLLDSLTAQTALLLERVVLQREMLSHERLRQELLSLNEAADLAAIKTLQGPHIDAAWRVSSRFEIGGDLCEISKLSGAELSLLIGDAMGDSVPAAVLMTAVHGALAALLVGDLAEARQTGRVLQRVNRSLFRARHQTHFMSLVYGVLDTGRLTFTYSNAGHPSPLLLREGAVRSLDTHGLLLGIVEQSEYDCECVELRPHDVLVFFSDGVTEARNAEACLFGRDRIIRSLGHSPHDVESDLLLQRVWSRLAEFGIPGHTDDRSLAIIRILP